MEKEKSAGAVVFIANKEIKYLLLHYEAGHWEFPRGNIEKGEEYSDTIKREVREETGITEIFFIEGFKEKSEWFFKREGKTVHKEVVYYLAETKQENITLSFEHQGFAWLPYQEAIKQVTFKNAKEILEKANSFLKNR